MRFCIKSTRTESNEYGDIVGKAKIIELLYQIYKNINEHGDIVGKAKIVYIALIKFLLRLLQKFYGLVL